MEIDITKLFNSDEYAPMDYSASVAEIGNDAGRVTWSQACEDAPEYNFLDTSDKLDAFRDHVKGFGAWSEEEIAAWSDVECNALFLQLVSGDIREAGIDTDAPDWDAYYAACEEGSASGSMSEGCDDGRVYYHLGS